MLHLYFHPLASFCWKVQIALYENDTPFVPHIVDLGDEASRAAFTALWPLAKMPVLRDEARGETIPETSIIIEYLDQHFPGKIRFLPADAALARRARLLDRIHDLYVQQSMQKIVLDRIRPAGQRDPYGVEAARAQLRTALDFVEQEMTAKTWALGDAFSLADCAAAPALYYADRVLPFSDTHPATATYLRRLMSRPSFARVLEEAQPYFVNFPQ
jgi:glutathione S-transferase